MSYIFSFKLSAPCLGKKTALLVFWVSLTKCRQKNKCVVLCIISFYVFLLLRGQLSDLDVSFTLAGKSWGYDNCGTKLWLTWLQAQMYVKISNISTITQTCIYYSVRACYTTHFHWIYWFINWNLLVFGSDIQHFAFWWICLYTLLRQW